MRKTKIKGKHLFNILGSSIVVLWIVLLGVLIQRTGFSGSSDTSGSGDKGALLEISSQREWMEIYLKGKKVGYSMNQATALEEGYLIQEEIFLKLNLMGQANNLRTITRSVVDKDFRLKNFHFNINSGVVGFQVSGRVKGDVIDIEIGQGDGTRNFAVSLSWYL